MFEKRGKELRQEQFWIEKKTLLAATASRFYERVDETLKKMGFAQAVWQIREPAYAKAARGGRPGIDPVVYLKMLMVGFFEDLPSEWAIASRCTDSFSVCGFLSYELTQPTDLAPVKWTRGSAIDRKHTRHENNTKQVRQEI